MTGQDAARHVVTVERAAAAAMPDRFSTAWYDDEADTIVISVVGRADSVDPALLQELSSTAGVPIEVVVAPHGATSTRLEQLFSAIEAGWSLLGARGIVVNGLYLSPELGAVVVTLDPGSTPASRATLVEEYGATGLMFAHDAGPAIATAPGISDVAAARTQDAGAP